MDQDREARWRWLSEAFLRCHGVPVNVALHLVTTPLGLFGLLALARGVSPPAALLVALLLVAPYPSRVPTGLAVAGALMVAGIAAAALALPVPWWIALAFVAAGYAGQDLAHLVTGEPTFQASYTGRRDAWASWAEHSLLLVPLVLHAADRAGFAAWFVARRRVVATTLVEAGARADLEWIRAWVDDQRPSRSHTTHWWRTDLPDGVRAAFDRVSGSAEIQAAFARCFSPASFRVEAVPGMNEVYVTGPDQDLTSDTVFYLDHVDGPFAAVPGASVFRVMVAVSPNEQIRTHFPMARSGSEPTSYVMSTGDVVGFDFHREVHRISAEPGKVNAGLRVSLKLHYVAVPRVAPFLGRWLAAATTAYNLRARRVFLDTLVPDSLRRRLAAAWVVGTTRAFDGLERCVGAQNLAWVLLLVGASLAAGSVLPFVVGTSFVHYTIYLATFHVRRHVAFPTFVRDVVFFKTLALLQLVLAYLAVFEVDVLSLALLGVGFGLSAWSAAVLGWERTYFGAELGVCAPLRTARGPYGVVPHPMIVGAMIGLLGFHALEPFRAAWPWLVPAHLAAYALHLIQEVLVGPVDAPVGAVAEEERRAA